MKRIIYIGNQLLPSGGNPTGIDTLTPRLRQLGYRVTTASSKKLKGIRLLDMLFTIFSNKRSCDLVLIDTYSTQNFWYAYCCGRLARLLNLPYYCILHGGSLPLRFKKSPRSISRLLHNAHENVAPSVYLKEFFSQQGFTNLRLIENYIDLKNYPFRKREDISPNLLWVRAFADVYEPLLALKILKCVTQRYPEAKLTMVGPVKDADCFEQCRIFAEKHQLSVQFTGRLPKEDWIALADSHELFLNTTKVDNTPVSVLEAMALGLPVLSTAVGGIPYLITDRKDGLLFANATAADFAKVIFELLNQPKLTQSISVQARQKVEQFDWEVIKEKWKKLLV